MKHLPYGVIALASLLVFIATPMLLLMIYPCKYFQQFLSFFWINWHFLHTFVDSFQGCFEDDTEQGTFDFRWMSAYGLFVRLALLASPICNHPYNNVLCVCSNCISVPDNHSH